MAQDEPVQQRNAKKGEYHGDPKKMIFSVAGQTEKRQGEAEQIDGADIVAEGEQILCLGFCQLFIAVLFGNCFGSQRKAEEETEKQRCTHGSVYGKEPSKDGRDRKGHGTAEV